MSITRKEGIAKLQKLFMEQESLNEQIKDIKTDLKEAGFNAAVIAAVAKAAAVGKLDELLEKSEETTEVIGEVRS